MVAYASVAALARGAGAGLPSAVILGVLAAGGSPSDASLLIAAFTAASGLGGPLIGTVVDRLEHPRRGYLVAAAVLASYSAMLSYALGNWSAGILVFLAGLCGLAHPLFFGAWSAQLPRIAPGVPPARAYSIDVGTYNVADIAGPAIVGVAYIADTVTPGAASLDVVCLMYIAAFIALLVIRVPPRSETHDAPPASFTATVRYASVLWRSVSLRRSTMVNTLGYMGNAGLVVSAPLLGADLAGDSGTGALLLAVVALGALIGSIVMVRRPLTLGPGTVVIGSTLAFAVTLALLAVAPTAWFAFAIALVAGMTQAPQLAAVMLIRDRESPKHARALVFTAASSLKTAAFAFGSLIAAALVTLGWRALLGGSAVIELLAVIIGLLVAGRRVRPPRRTPRVGDTGTD